MRVAGGKYLTKLTPKERFSILSGNPHSSVNNFILGYILELAKMNSQDKIE